MTGAIIRRSVAISALVFGLMCCAVPASAQTGQVKGKVLDTQGNVVDGAKIEIQSLDKGGKPLETKSNKRGEYMQARETFKAALALEPEDPSLRFNLGQCYDRLGDQDRAEKAYRECLQRAADHVESRHALCVLLDF